MKIHLPLGLRRALFNAFFAAVCAATTAYADTNIPAGTTLTYGADDDNANLGVVSGTGALVLQGSETEYKIYYVNAGTEDSPLGELSIGKNATLALYDYSNKYTYASSGTIQGTLYVWGASIDTVDGGSVDAMIDLELNRARAAKLEVGDICVRDSLSAGTSVWGYDLTLGREGKPLADVSVSDSKLTVDALIIHGNATFTNSTVLRRTNTAVNLTLSEGSSLTLTNSTIDMASTYVGYGLLQMGGNCTVAGLEGEGIQLGTAEQHDLFSSQGDYMTLHRDAQGAYSFSAANTATDNNFALSKGTATLSDTELGNLTVGNGTDAASLTISGPLTVHGELAVYANASINAQGNAVSVNTYRVAYNQTLPEVMSQVNVTGGYVIDAERTLSLDYYSKEWFDDGITLGTVTGAGTLELQGSNTPYTVTATSLGTKDTPLGHLRLGEGVTLDSRFIYLNGGIELCNVDLTLDASYDGVQLGNFTGLGTVTLQDSDTPYVVHCGSTPGLDVQFIVGRGATLDATREVNNNLDFLNTVYGTIITSGHISVQDIDGATLQGESIDVYGDISGQNAFSATSGMGLYMPDDAELEGLTITCGTNLRVYGGGDLTLVDSTINIGYLRLDEGGTLTLVGGNVYLGGYVGLFDGSTLVGYEGDGILTDKGFEYSTHGDSMTLTSDSRLYSANTSADNSFSLTAGAASFEDAELADLTVGKVNAATLTLSGATIVNRMLTLNPNGTLIVNDALTVTGMLVLLEGSTLSLGEGGSITASSVFAPEDYALPEGLSRSTGLSIAAGQAFSLNANYAGLDLMAVTGEGSLALAESGTAYTIKASSVGTADTPLAALSLGKGSTLAVDGDIHVSRLDIADASSLAMQEGATITTDTYHATGSHTLLTNARIGTGTVIDAGQTLTVTNAHDGMSLGSVTGAGQLTLADSATAYGIAATGIGSANAPLGSLRAGAGSTLDLQGGTAHVASYEVTGQHTLSGTIIAGQTSIADGVTYTVDNAGTQLGSIAMGDGSSLIGYAGEDIALQSGAASLTYSTSGDKLTVQTDAVGAMSMSTNNSSTSNSFTLSEGTVSFADAELATLTIGNGTDVATLTSSGAMTVSDTLTIMNKGALIVASDVNVTGTLVILSGASVTLNGGTLDYNKLELKDEGSAFNGVSGELLLGDSLSATLVGTADVSVTNGAYTLTDQADTMTALTLAKGTLTLNDSTLATLTIGNGSDAATLTNAAAMTVSDRLTINGNGTLNVACDITVDGTLVLQDGGKFVENGGKLTLSKVQISGEGSGLGNYGSTEDVTIQDSTGSDALVYNTEGTAMDISGTAGGGYTLGESSASDTNNIIISTNTNGVTLTDEHVNNLTVTGEVTHKGSGLTADGTVTLNAGSTLDMAGQELDAQNPITMADGSGIANHTGSVEESSGIAYEATGSGMTFTKDDDGAGTLSDTTGSADNGLRVTDGAITLTDNALGSLDVQGGTVTMGADADGLSVGTLSGTVGGVTGDVKLGSDIEATISQGSMSVTRTAGGTTFSDSASAGNGLAVTMGEATLDDAEMGALAVTGSSKVKAIRDLKVGELVVGSELDMGGNTLTVDGVAEVAASGSIHGDVTVASGTLNDNGNINGTIIVEDGARMEGSGTNTGLVIVEGGGHLHIGNSPGYRNFAHGLTLHNGATISFSVDGVTPAARANTAGCHSYAEVTGGVLTLATGSTAIAQVDIMGGIVAAGYKPFALTLLEVDPSAVNGEGDFTLSLTGQTDLLLTSATSLDWDPATGKLIFRSMLNPGNVEARALESGAAIASSLWSSTSAVRAFARNATSQLSAPVTTENGVTVWGSAIGDYVTMSGLRSTAHGCAVGADKQFCPHIRAGLSFGQMFGDYTADRGLAEVEQDSMMVGLYGEYARELNKRHGFSVTAYAAYGRVDNDADTRALGLAELPGKSSWDDDVFVAGFRAYWNMRVTDKTTVSPFIGLEYQRGDQSSFTETYDGGSNCYAGGAMQVWSLPVGVTAHTECDLGNGQKLLPWLTVGYVADIARQNPHMDGSVLGQDYRFEGTSPGRHGFMLNAGANWQISESWSAGASYNFETRSHETSHEGNFSVRYSF